MSRSTEADDPVRALLASRIEERWMPGGCWWIEGPAGPVSRGAVGQAALIPDPEPLAETTPYDLASLTKPLATALLALLLEQRGRLDTGLPVGECVAELSRTPYRERTLVDLAAHRAGFPAWRPLYLEGATLDEYMRAIARVPPLVPSGETLYSDLGYLVLGAAIERAAGESLDSLFERWIAGPLKLRRTGFATGERGFDLAAPTECGNAYEREMAGQAGDSYPWRTGVLRGEVHDANAHGLGGVAGHSGLFGTLEEVAALVREILRPERVGLAAKGRARLLEPVPGSDGRTFGMVLAGDSAAARGALRPDAPGHTGFTGTSIWLEPERDAFYILLTNRVHPEVQRRGLQPVREGFHRLAASLV